MAFSIPGPRAATTAMASSVEGKARMTSMERLITESVARPPYPARSPRRVPGVAPRATATTPTRREMRPP